MHPILTQIPGPWGLINLYSFGSCLGIGVLCAWVIFRRQSKQHGVLRQEERGPFFLLLLVSGALGAALCTAALSTLGTLPHAIIQGASVIAAFIMVGLCLVWHARSGSVSSLRLADMLVPCLAILYAWMEFGLYLDGSAYGTLLGENSSSSLVTLGTYTISTDSNFTSLPLILADQMDAGLIAQSATSSLPVHPVQLYELGLGLCIAAYSSWRAKLGLLAGHLFREAIFLFGIGQGLLAIFHDLSPLAMGLLVSTWIGLAFAFLGFVGPGSASAFDSKPVEP